MLVKNVLNKEKKDKIFGNTFHVFFLGLSCVLYDSLFDEPIIYGNKNIVKNKVKNLNKILSKQIRNVKITYYTIFEEELKKRFKYDGPIDDIIVPNY
jgi:hypothetical protein